MSSERVRKVAGGADYQLCPGACRAQQALDGPDKGGDEGERVHGHDGAGWGLVDPNPHNVNRIGVTGQALSDPLIEDAAWRPEVSATLCLFKRMLSVARTGAGAARQTRQCAHALR